MFYKKVWYSNDGTNNLTKNFGANKDGEIGDGRYYMGCWLPVTPEYLEKALANGSNLQWTYKFDWDGDKQVDQTFTATVDPDNITLNKDGSINCKTENGVMTIKDGHTISSVELQKMSDDVYGVGYNSWAGHPANIAAMQSGVTVTPSENNPKQIIISGTFHYVTGFTGFYPDKPEAQEGHYAALMFPVPKNVDTSKATFTLVNGEAGQANKTYGPGTTPTFEEILDTVGTQRYVSFLYKVKKGTEFQFMIDWDGNETAYSEATYTVKFLENAIFENKSYTVTFDSQGGSTIESTTVEYNGNITKPANPTRSGYTFGGWYTDAICETAWNFEADHVTENTTLYAKWTKNSSGGGGGTTPAPANPFVDVKDSAYYYDAVLWAAKNNIVVGITETTFSPDDSCTRAQMVTFLWRAAGSPKATGSNPFTDVSADAHYHDAVLWAVEKGITVGTSDTTFSPDATVTRAQTVTFLYRYAGKPATSAANPFTDVSTDAYYAPAVQWAVANDITVGTSATTFSPNNDCTRAQIVTFLYRDLAK